MNMTGFVSNCTFTVPNPAKHVKYTLGMVLGVDDFEQEFSYHDGHLRWAIRDLHGYGTVNGLRVMVEKETKGLRVRITKGAAVMPSGHLVCVSMDQCAYLNDWLKVDKHQEAIQSKIINGPSGSSVTLYVVLRYRCCPTDPMPIPGEPCRSEDSLTAASRFLDDFILELRVEPPPQTEHKLIKEFRDWLTQVTIVDSGSTISKEEFLEAIRNSLMISSPPASPPEDMLLSPPATVGSPAETFQIDRADVSDYFKAAWRLWVTELRPLVHPLCVGSGSASCCDHDGTEQDQSLDEKCLLLAALDVPLTSAGEVASSSDVLVNEEDRAVLLPMQFIQNWLASPIQGSALSPPESIVPMAMKAMAPGGLGGPMGAGLAGSEAPSGRVVAAGQFTREGRAVVPSFGDLSVKFNEDQFVYVLQSPHIRRDKLNTLRATAITTSGSTVTHVMEAVEAGSLTDMGLSGTALRKALALRVRQSTGKMPTQAYQGFIVEITEFDQ